MILHCRNVFEFLGLGRHGERLANMVCEASLSFNVLPSPMMNKYHTIKLNSLMALGHLLNFLLQC